MQSAIGRCVGGLVLEHQAGYRCTGGPDQTLLWYMPENGPRQRMVPEMVPENGIGALPSTSTNGRAWPLAEHKMPQEKTGANTS